ncbi:hypothetical protein SBRCBS47491_003867 [Sporothrix bragantina]|uniref:NADP-dependent oxidoreductase domain-containing protein n=1 Tax=Sporothrix bragantina TaxID=671064 RepID=A0ABP0BJ48_9PEZI
MATQTVTEAPAEVSATPSTSTSTSIPSPAAIAFSKSLPCLVLGGAGFSYQTHPDPESLPVASIVREAFDHGLRVIDTAPLYEPSEQLLGQALIDPDITDRYARTDYVLMTKVGRTGPETYDYSPAWVDASVRRSLARLHTTYLDVVFCHDMEAVTDADVLAAVGALRKLVDEGLVRHIGLSSYRLDLLSQRSQLVREHFSVERGPVIDVVQTWGQLTLQNSRLEMQTEGLVGLRAAGVAHVFSSSPLGIGLLRKEGVPLGKLGDFHPAPPGLRQASRRLAEYISTQGENLAAVALRYALWRAHVAGEAHGIRVSTITGISSHADLAENAEALRQVIKGDLRSPELNTGQSTKDQVLFTKAHEILGDWVDWNYMIPAEGWDQEKKCVVKG